MIHSGFRRIPWSILCCILILMGCGLAGIARGDELAGQGHYFQKQCIWILISLLALGGTILFPYRNLRGVSYPLFLGTLLLLIAVFFIPAVNGSRRWIPLGFFKFQPSELAKITYILALAHYLMYRQNYRRI
ncbi:MAG: FtsW/RodA/SpoVE family cell cycle protein, partial [Planctomycetaceae bacterium]|nr:FtsW/RodA/SpoVE family cell cycle protein [Planctomycetaceae bacterium]